jgi:hypothetical protein
MKMDVYVVAIWFSAKMDRQKGHMQDLQKKANSHNLCSVAVDGNARSAAVLRMRPLRPARLGFYRAIPEMKIMKSRTRP